MAEGAHRAASATEVAAVAAKVLVTHVSHRYNTRGGDLLALNDVSLDVPTGQFVAIVGPSGCGKSTLLHIIAGLLPASEGMVRIDGQPIGGPDPRRVVVFQSDAVFPWMTVENNIAYGLRHGASLGLTSKQRRARVEHYLDKVGLEPYRRLYPKELSGGMRKRVELARAYATEPELLLLDEPFGSLDALTRQALQVDLATMLAEDGTRTILLVTHDIEEAVFLADRVVVMTDRPGRIASTYDVPFGRPRAGELIASVEFQTLRYEIRNQLELKVT